MDTVAYADFTIRSVFTANSRRLFHFSEKIQRASVEDEMSASRDIQAGVPQGSVLSPALYSLYINDTSQTPGSYVRLFVDDTYLYATDHKEGYVLRKLQRGLSAIETWCERWNIKINQDKTQAIYFSHRLRPSEAHLTLNGRNIPFHNHVRYLGVIFNKRIT
jgi:hypothetical protein